VERGGGEEGGSGQCISAVIACLINSAGALDTHPNTHSTAANDP